MSDHDDFPEEFCDARKLSSDLRRNHLPSLDNRYWVRANQDGDNYVYWKSRDGKYNAWLEYGDPDTRKLLYSFGIDYAS